MNCETDRERKLAEVSVSGHRRGASNAAGQTQAHSRSLLEEVFLLPNYSGGCGQIFVKSQREKRAKWPKNKAVQAFNYANRTVAVATSKWKQIRAVTKDARPAMTEDELASAVLNAIGDLDRNLYEVVDPS